MIGAGFGIYLEGLLRQEDQADRWDLQLRALPDQEDQEDLHLPSRQADPWRQVRHLQGQGGLEGHHGRRVQEPRLFH